MPGTLDPSGGPPYDQPVMDKVNELRRRGSLKGGFDRAGSSNADPRDNETWPKIFKTKGKEYLFETNEGKRKELIKSTYWFLGYRTAAKAQMNLECQNFGGTLDIVCIKGGPITDVEHEEMEQIIQEAKRDASVNGIKINIKLKKLSYLEFLREYDPRSLTPKSGKQTLESEPEPEANLATAHHADDGSVEAPYGDVAQTVTIKEELAALKRENIALKLENEGLKAQRQVATPEGVPPGV